jgi:hypothetical protein
MSSVTAMYIGHKTHHLNIRTYLMAAVLLIVVAGFVMMAYGKNQATKLIGYCECPGSFTKSRTDSQTSPAHRMPSLPSPSPWSTATLVATPRNWSPLPSPL